MQGTLHKKINIRLIVGWRTTLLGQSLYFRLQLRQ
ncbi:hypothetical protein SAMN06265337_2268 [Hymenobacter gelipurpurascens]|uniref:Uncharacterized protein n=1 Tax=Hymenobacter gelipurpurascens TaxID=89968 RepID=A0A212TQQ9_9BACT|nr:hypothetical protein SAMN06265337_2268 [Hymenobacter gelipurpurascens]